MPSYRVGKVTIASGSPDFEDEIASAHSDKIRPLCLCQRQGIETYIARLDDKHIVKRMPGTGSQHDSACEHFEPPASLSGLGDVMGKAIQNQTDGTSVLKLDFSLTRSGGRAAPKPSENPGATVKSDASKLTLLGLLHYLWHEADLHRWAASFRGKRNWRVVRSRLLDAASHKMSKKMPLLDRLYIPEPFFADHAEDIDLRRSSFLRRFRSSDPKKRELILIVAEVKSMEPARYGTKIVVKHAPRFSIFLDDKAHAQVKKKFSAEIAINEANETSHLMMIATASVNEANAAVIEEIGLMLVNSDWLPVESIEEFSLLETLTTDSRSFLKGLRFNVRDRPLASALLTDTKPPVGLYLVPPDEDAAFAGIIDELSAQTGIKAWKWDLEDGTGTEIAVSDGLENGNE